MFLICSTISNMQNEWNVIVPLPYWIEEPFASTMDWIRSLSYVLCESTGHPWSPCFHGKTDHSLKAFGPTTHCFDRRWETIPGCTVNIKGGLSAKCNMTETNMTCYYLKNWWSWTFLAVCACALVHTIGRWVAEILSGPPQTITHKRKQL